MNPDKVLLVRSDSDGDLVSVLSQELKWSLSPQTPISWLNVYMQVAYLKETDELLIPRYPQATFTQIAEVQMCTETHSRHSYLELSTDTI